MKAENIDTRTKPLLNVDTLCYLLRFVIRRMKYPQVIQEMIAACHNDSVVRELY